MAATKQGNWVQLPVVVATKGQTTSPQPEEGVLAYSPTSKLMFSDGTKWDAPASDGAITLSTTAKHVWLNASAANDSADGLTQATPKKTLAAIWAILAQTPVVSGPFILHVTGNFTWSEPPAVTMLGPDAYLGIVGMTDQVLATLTVSTTQVQASTVEFTGAAPAEDLWVGASVRIVTGNSAGSRRTIVQNTSTNLRAGLSFTNLNGSGSAVLLTAGTTLEVVRPTATITYPPGVSVLNDYPIHFANIVLKPDETVYNTYLRKPYAYPADLPCLMLGVEIRGTLRNIYGVRLYGGLIDIANTTYTADLGQIGRIAIALGYNSFRHAFSGWGIGAGPAGSDTTTSYGFHQGSAFEGTLAVRCYLFFADGGPYVFNGLRASYAFAALNVLLSVQSGYLKPTVGVGNGYTALRASQSAKVRFGGLIHNVGGTVNESIGIHAIDNAEVTVVGGDSVWTCANSVAGGAAFKVAGNARVVIGTSFTITLSGCPTFIVQENGSLALESLTASQGTATSEVRGNGLLSIGGTLALTNTQNPCLKVSDNAEAAQRTGSTLTCTTAAGPGAVVVDGGMLAMPFGASCSLTNTQTSGTPAGLQCTNGGLASFGTVPTIQAIAQAGIGYGIDLRGGGRVTMAYAPGASVAGNAGDLRMGPAVSDVYADSVLAATYSSIMVGMSCVQRTT